MNYRHSEKKKTAVTQSSVRKTQITTRSGRRDCDDRAERKETAATPDFMTYTFYWTRVNDVKKNLSF